LMDCVNAPSPGFDVHGGQITGLEGGVFGPSDVPFVDFFGTTFSSVDYAETNLRGSLQVLPIPEPPTLLLLSSGVALATLVIRRRHGDRHRSTGRAASPCDIGAMSPNNQLFGTDFISGGLQ
jgi:hypothetical protein